MKYFFVKVNPHLSNLPDYAPNLPVQGPNLLADYWHSSGERFFSTNLGKHSLAEVQKSEALM